jgi:translation initiation factor IF-2
VTEGLVRRGAQCRLVRDGTVIYDGRIGSLRRFKDDVREVKSGFECGIGIENFQDIKVGDVLEAYTVEQHERQLT